MQRKILFLLLVTIFICTSLTSGTTGKLAGKVTDNEGNPIPFSNITVMDGETLIAGIRTKENGSYYIINIPPGKYDVFCMRGGFRPGKAVGVVINLDLTTMQNFQLKTQAVEIPGYSVVEASVQMVQKERTSSGITVTSDTIEDISVSSIEDIIAIQAGVTLTNGEIHIRGGRSNEVAYTVDGMSVSDPVDGGAALTIDTDAIANMDVMTGGLTAEYGNAQSGMVNIVTKSGSRDYSGKIEFSSDHLINSFDNSNSDVFKFAIGGPVLTSFVSSLRDKFTFYFNCVGNWHDTRYHGYCDLKPYDEIDGLVSSWSDYEPYTPFEGREDFIGFDLGDRNYNDYNANLKLKYRFNERQNLTFAIRGDSYDHLPFSHTWRYALEHYAKTSGDQRQYIATYDHTIGSQINIKVKASMYENIITQAPRDISRDDWFALDPDPETFDLYGDNQLGNTDGILYLTAEDDNIVSDVEDYAWVYETGEGNVIAVPFIEPGTVWGTYIDDENLIYQLRSDVEYQVNETHGLKSGFEVIKHCIKKDQRRNPWNLSDARYEKYLQDCTPEESYAEGDTIIINEEEIIIPAGGLDFYSREDLLAATIAASGLTDGYEAEPWQGGFYVQDAMVWEGLIINAGIRCDVWYLGSDYKIKTASYNGSYLKSIDPDDSLNVNTYYVLEDENDPDSPLVPPDPILYPQAYAKYISAQEYHDTISDRFSKPQFMISPRLGVSHPISERSVLHFVYNYQRQLPQMQYIFTTGRPQDVIENPGANIIVGNPELKDQTTITYEAGLQYQLHEDYVMDLTTYYKNIYNYVSTEEKVDPADNSIKWNEYISEDYGSVRGIDLNLQKLLSNFFQGSASYSLSWAYGNHSETTTTGDESLREFPLTWDLRHSFNLNLVFKVGAGEDFYIPFTETVLPLRNFTINFLYGISSGAPYTPISEDDVVLETNSATRPFNETANLKFSKNFSFGKNMKLKFYANIKNLFNRPNHNSVYGKTGSPFYSGIELDFNNDGYIDPNTYSVYSVLDRNPSHVSVGRTISFGLAFLW